MYTCRTMACDEMTRIVGVGNTKSFKEMMDQYDPRTNRSLPVMTRFEKAKILGLRTEQVARGAEPVIDTDDIQVWDPSEIAQRELATKTIPFVIRRPMPDGSLEIWKITDLAVLSA